MPEKEFMEQCQRFRERESVLDGSCKHETVIGLASKHMMEKTGLIRNAGLRGITRIVIEYNNDTGEGWRRIVAEDPITVSTEKYQSEGQ